MSQRRYKKRAQPKGKPEYRVFEGYDTETREEMAAILEKKIKASRTPDMDRVQQELLDLTQGLELAYPDSEKARIWHEFKAEEPDHAECAHAFEIAAAADDPIAAARADDRVGPRLSGMLRNWWLADWRRKGRNGEPSLRTIEWDLLNPAEQDEVRAMLRHLASFERQFVQQGTPPGRCCLTRHWSASPRFIYATPITGEMRSTKCRPAGRVPSYGSRCSP